MSGSSSDSTTTARAVGFDEYGGIDVLHVDTVDVPAPPAGEVLVRVRAAGINPGEAVVRSGAMAEMFPTTFPSGEGSDLAGDVVAVGDGVTSVAVGDAVLGWTDRRGSHAELVTVPVENLVPKPDAVPYEVAGALYVAGAAAVASVGATDPKDGERVLVSGATGGVGSIAVQLAILRGARVIGVASERNHEYLRTLGAIPVAYGDGLADALRAVAPDGLDAVVDTYGGGYVALGIELGVDPSRINTIIDFAVVSQYGVHAEGTSSVSGAEVLGRLAELVATDRLVVEIAATYPLDQVREAFTEVEARHTRGKIVLVP